MVLFAVVPQDVPARLLDVICTAEVLQNTSKHVQLSLEAAELVEYVLKIARQMVGKGDPLPISAGGVPNSPLHYSEDVAIKFIRLRAKMCRVSSFVAQWPGQLLRSLWLDFWFNRMPSSWQVW